MKMSDMIAAFLAELIEVSEGEAEIQRNELAMRFHCVPSQINYVIATRFNAENGYVVESRRGGGGSIKIRRVQLEGSNYLMHVVHAIGDRISQTHMQVFVRNMFEQGILSKREANMMLAALGDKSIFLPQPEKDQMRATLLKNMLVSMI